MTLFKLLYHIKESHHPKAYLTEFHFVLLIFFFFYQIVYIVHVWFKTDTI